MHRFKTPKKTLFDHLTHDNYFLNERYNEAIKLYNESVKMIETLRTEVEYLNKFVFSTFDLSSNNYSGNLKIVSYDSSDNVISYICTDSSGNFTSTIPLGEQLKKYPFSDISNNVIITDMSRNIHYVHPPYCHPYCPPYHPPYYPPHRPPYRDIDDDRGITSKPTNVIHTTTVNGVLTHKDEEPRCLHSYWGYPYLGYPYDHYPYDDYPYNDYPYNILDNDDYRNVELNHDEL